MKGLAKTLTDLLSDSKKVDSDYLSSISDYVSDAYLYVKKVDESGDPEDRDKKITNQTNAYIAPEVLPVSVTSSNNY